MRKFAALFALACAGCSGGAYRYRIIQTPDHRKIECIVLHDKLRGGISCNWATPR